MNLFELGQTIEGYASLNIQSAACSKVLSPLSSCQKCQDICPVQALDFANGQWSAMRVASLLVTAVVLLMWVGFCLYEKRLIPLTWQDVAIIGGAQGAKALQSRFEWGGDGIWGRGGMGNPWDGEGL